MQNTTHKWPLLGFQMIKGYISLHISQKTWALIIRKYSEIIDLPTYLILIQMEIFNWQQNKVQNTTHNWPLLSFGRQERTFGLNPRPKHWTKYNRFISKMRHFLMQSVFISTQFSPSERNKVQNTTHKWPFLTFRWQEGTFGLHLGP